MIVPVVSIRYLTGEVTNWAHDMPEVCTIGTRIVSSSLLRLIIQAYLGHSVVCVLPKYVEGIPKLVSVVEKGCDQAQNALEVINNKLEYYKEK